MIRADVELLVANEHELKSLYLTDDLDAAMARAAAEIPVTACTVGAGRRPRPDRRRAGPRAGHAGRASSTSPGRATSSPPGCCTASPPGATGLTCLRDGQRRRRRGDLARRRPPRGRPAPRSSPRRACPDRRPGRRPRSRGTPQDNPRLGIALMILTTLVFAVQDGMSRHLAAHYSVMTVVMIRYWFFAAFVLATAAASRGGIRRGRALGGAAAAGRPRRAARRRDLRRGALLRAARADRHPRDLRDLPAAGRRPRRAGARRVRRLAARGWRSPSASPACWSSCGPASRCSARWRWCRCSAPSCSRSTRCSPARSRAVDTRRDQPVLHRRRRRGGDHPGRAVLVDADPGLGRLGLDAGALRLRRSSGTS